jgi:hypothetical protein
MARLLLFLVQSALLSTKNVMYFRASDAPVLHMYISTMACHHCQKNKSDRGAAADVMQLIAIRVSQSKSVSLVMPSSKSLLWVWRNLQTAEMPIIPLPTDSVAMSS